MAYQVDEAAAIAGAEAQRRAYEQARAELDQRKDGHQPSRPSAGAGATLEQTDAGWQIRGHVPILWPNGRPTPPAPPAPPSE